MRNQLLCGTASGTAVLPWQYPAQVRNNSPDEGNYVAPSHIRSRPLKHVYKVSTLYLLDVGVQRGGCVVGCSFRSIPRTEVANISVNMGDMCTKGLVIWGKPFAHFVPRPRPLFQCRARLNNGICQHKTQPRRSD